MSKLLSVAPALRARVCHAGLFIGLITGRAAKLARRAALLPGLLWLGLLSACGVTPVPPQVLSAPPAPATWQHPEAGKDERSGGWQGLHDELLLNLQTQALSANRDLASAALRWQQSQRLLTQSEWRWQPTAALNATASRALSEPGRAQAWSRSVGSSLSLSYEADLWQRLAANSALLAAQSEALRTDIAAAQVLIRLQVAQAYWQVAAAQAQLPLARRQVEDAQEVVQLTLARVTEGKLLPIEVDKAGVSLQAARVRLASLEADAQLARHALALLLGQDLPGPDLSQAQLPRQDLPLWHPEPPAQVLARRPDVQRARLGVDGALAGLRGAEAARYPSLSFTAGLGTGGQGLGDWLRQPLASLGASLVVPMIDWRRLDVQRDNARSDLELAALALRDTLAKALTEVEDQLIEQRRQADQLQASALRLRDAQEGERLAQLRLTVGSVSRLDWLQTRAALLQAQQDLLRARLSVWLQQAQLYKALGGPPG